MVSGDGQGCVFDVVHANYAISRGTEALFAQVAHNAKRHEIVGADHCLGPGKSLGACSRSCIRRIGEISAVDNKAFVDG